MAPHAAGSATSEQIDVLLNFLDEHRELACGKLRSTEGKVLAKRLWEELCNTLNSMGCAKTVQQWQKVWFDKKYLAKRAAAEARRSASKTGGPFKVPQLTRWETKIISIMGDGSGARQIKARLRPRERAFCEIKDEPLQSSSSQADQRARFPRPRRRMDLPEKVVEPVVLNQRSRRTSQLVNSRRQSNPRRRQSSDSNVSSRLIQLEESRAEREIIRNTELQGIRSELTGIRTAIVDLFELISKDIRNQ